MKRHHITLIALTAVCALLMTACVKLGGKPVDKRFYQLTPQRSAPASTGDSDMVLKVRRATVSDIYSGRELIYKMKDGRIESDFYNMYFVAPGNMLTAELRNWLAASGQFAHIVEPGSMVVSDLTLETVVNSLYGDYTAEQPAAVVEVQFFVVDESTPNNVIVFSTEYKKRIPFSKPDPGQLVRSMTKGVQDIFTELEKDLAAANLNR